METDQQKIDVLLRERGRLRLRHAIDGRWFRGRDEIRWSEVCAELYNLGWRKGLR